MNKRDRFELRQVVNARIDRDPVTAYATCEQCGCPIFKTDRITVTAKGKVYCAADTGAVPSETSALEANRKVN